MTSSNCSLSGTNASNPSTDSPSSQNGAAWPIARYHIPFLRNFDLKLSYHPSDLLGNPGGVGFKGQKHLMIDDYEGQTMWLGLNIHNLLPESAKPYWPEFHGYRCVNVGHCFLCFGRQIDAVRCFPVEMPSGVDYG